MQRSSLNPELTVTKKIDLLQEFFAAVNQVNNKLAAQKARKLQREFPAETQIKSGIQITKSNEADK